MLDEGPRRNLSERTGRHLCIRCLAEVDAETYLRNDHVCDSCAEAEMKPPEKSATAGKRKKNDVR
jgi:hypothetical protein